MRKRDLFDPQMKDSLALIREREVAERWKKSLRTLQRWRADGYGPAYLRIGGTIFYRSEDILNFEARVRRGGEML